MNRPEGDALAVGLEEAPGRLTRRLFNRQQARIQTDLPPQRFPTEVPIRDLRSSSSTVIPAIDTEGALHRYYERACACIDRGQFHLAVSLLVRVVRQTEENSEAWFHLGFAYTELGRTDRAIDCFNNVIRMHPERAEAWNNRGWNRLRRKDYRKAIDDFTQATDLSPGLASAWFNLGLSYTCLKNFEKAASAFEQASVADPANERTRYYWGIALLRSGKRDAAMRCFRSVCETNSLFIRAWWQLLIHRARPQERPKSVRAEKTKAIESQIPVQALPNMGRILQVENPLMDRRTASAQERLQKLWQAAQNPVTWILIFVLSALVYILLGN